jgi:hypothetical protein
MQVVLRTWHEKDELGGPSCASTRPVSASVTHTAAVLGSGMVYWYTRFCSGQPPASTHRVVSVEDCMLYY